MTELFKVTPFCFHAYVSDVSPESVHSLCQTLVAAAEKGAARNKLAAVLKRTKSCPRFACSTGVYGAAHGLGASASLILDFQEVAAGPPYVPIRISQVASATFEKELIHAKEDGCFAFVTEIVW